MIEFEVERFMFTFRALFSSRRSSTFQCSCCSMPQDVGIYVNSLTKCKVNSYAEIDQIMESGIANRTIGSTLMNNTSSRAHTVLGIELRQLSHVGDRTGVKMSCIYLVDLAGSEKAKKTGATGDRLKEGSAINQSLTCLGNVIEKVRIPAESFF